jgi:hypothetical protein
MGQSGDRIVYAACAVRGPNLLVARRCAVCGALATVVPGDDRVMGRLPELCRREHDNVSIEMAVVVGDLYNAAREVVDAEGPTPRQRTDFWAAVDRLREVLDA